jgi:AcrR family transcriptional regulator
MAGVKGQVQQRGVERRRAIVDAAIELFSSNGFRGTGIAAVAAKAGLTPSGVLHHFGSKEGLLQAVVEERDARAWEPLAAFWRTRGLDAIRRGYDWLGRFIEGDRELAALHTVLIAENLRESDPLQDFFRRRARTVRAGTRRMLARAKEDGEVRADVDVAAVADEIIAFQEGAQLVWLQDPERISIARLYERYFKDLTDRLREAR